MPHGGVALVGRGVAFVGGWEFFEIDLEAKAEGLLVGWRINNNCVLDFGYFFENGEPAAEVVSVVGLRGVVLGFLGQFGGFVFFLRFGFGRKWFFLFLFIFLCILACNQLLELLLVVLVFARIRVAAN